MPCYYDGPIEFELEKLKTNNGFLNAALCGMFHALEKAGTLEQTINNIDYQEAGITKSKILKWWGEHQEEDRKRHEYEKEEREIKEAAKAAIVAKGMAKRREEVNRLYSVFIRQGFDEKIAAELAEESAKPLSQYMEGD